MTHHHSFHLQISTQWAIPLGQCQHRSCSATPRHNLLFRGAICPASYDHALTGGVSLLQNSTAEEMEAVMEQYRNALAEMERQRQEDEWDDNDEEDTLEAFHDVIDEGECLRPVVVAGNRAIVPPPTANKYGAGRGAAAGIPRPPPAALER